MSKRELIQQDKCYCLKDKEVIDIIDCKMFDGCKKEKSCRKKSAQDYRGN